MSIYFYGLFTGLVGGFLFGFIIADHNAHKRYMRKLDDLNYQSQMMKHLISKSK